MTKYERGITAAAQLTGFLLYAVASYHLWGGWGVLVCLGMQIAGMNRIELTMDELLKKNKR